MKVSFKLLGFEIASIDLDLGAPEQAAEVATKVSGQAGQADVPDLGQGDDGVMGPWRGYVVLLGSHGLVLPGQWLPERRRNVARRRRRGPDLERRLG